MILSQSAPAPLRHDAEHRDLAAVVHAVEHVVERARVAAHLQADVEAFHVQVGHHVLERGVGHVDHAGRAHVGGELEAEIVDVGDHDIARADVLADAGGDHADRAGAGDQHVLADHVEFQRAVRGIAVRIEERGEFATGSGPGSATGCEAGITMYSANAPARFTPMPTVFGHRCWRPARQLRQCPQTMWPSADTRWPTCSHRRPGRFRRCDRRIHGRSPGPA